MFIFEKERERERAWVREGQREGDAESEAGFRLWAVSREPSAGLELMNCKIMTWTEVRHLMDWATQMPQILSILKCTFFHIINFPKVNMHLIIKVDILNIIIVHLFLMFIYFERERENEWTGEGQREEERESQASPVLPAQSPMQGSILISQTLRSWPEPKSRIRHLTDWAMQAPHTL